MKKKIIIRISNEIGNQMFMFASAFSISKKMDRTLFIDNESAFLSKKNISKYGLNNFNIRKKVTIKSHPSARGPLMTLRNQLKRILKDFYILAF